MTKPEGSDDWGPLEVFDFNEARPQRTAEERRAARKKWEGRLDSFSGLRFFIGGFFGTSEEHTLTVENGYVKGSWLLFPGFHPEDAYCTTSYGGGEGWAIEEFCDVLRRSMFGGWEDYYENPDVCDGESWSLRIEFFDGGEAFESGGSNCNPRGLGVLKRKLGVGNRPDNWFY